MLTTSTLPLALLATTLSTVTAHSFNSPHGHQAIRRAPSHHWNRSNLPGSSRPRMARRGSSDEPSTLSEGSLSAAEGCTQWYHVNAGDSCYSAIATVNGGLPLESFYAMNPQINEDCFNLWAGFDYCVARTTTSSSSSSTTAKAVANNAVVHAVKTTTTSQAPAPTTTAAPTSSAVDDEEDCDAEDEEWASSTSAAPVRANVAQTTTAAPATSTDDSAAKAAASKASADAAWASSSKASADAAWASSSKASADAAWASSSKAAAAAAQTTSSAPAETTKVADVGGNANAKLAAMGISTFLGEQTNGIASWFHTNSATDSTNGNSWCFRPYDDSLVGFAPSLKTMTASFGGDAIAAAKAFCGLYADVTTPDGKTVKMMILDAFDDSWVLTPSSIDVTYGSFHLLYGSTTDNKNDVVQGVSWKLTGERNPDYVFNNGNPL